ncbi:hypothetical protein B0H16DRAFT_1467803 [Mycena metata]|uniref:Uncharacterized protein n=1 Tax=Mycena metata TaxID=1033252 RepID=A0AAD7I4E0_9AGAR|nr:hypothetical protein B0H16DRAFT_1467803 [Mycena metata]
MPESTQRNFLLLSYVLLDSDFCRPCGDLALDAIWWGKVRERTKGRARALRVADSHHTADDPNEPNAQGSWNGTRRSAWDPLTLASTRSRLFSLTHANTASNLRLDTAADADDVNARNKHSKGCGDERKGERRGEWREREIPLQARQDKPIKFSLFLGGKGITTDHKNSCMPRHWHPKTTTMLSVYGRRNGKDKLRSGRWIGSSAPPSEESQKIAPSWSDQRGCISRPRTSASAQAKPHNNYWVHCAEGVEFCCAKTKIATESHSQCNGRDGE